MEMYANLHMHSTHSDGPYSPSQLVCIAKDEGYKAMTISDHDTASAYAEMKAACEKEGMDYIFAAEFTVIDKNTYGGEYHIIGFEFDPEYTPMKKYLADMALRQTDNTKKCFEEAAFKGDISGISWDEVLDFNKGIPWLCNNHVFEALKAKGLVKEEEYIPWFDKNFRAQRGKYPPIYDFLPLKDIVKLIKDAGGIAMIAHPHKQLDEIDYLIECGIEGMEVWHPDLTEEEKERAYKIALEKNLYISGGSDHSGLCGGYYSSCPEGMDIKDYYLYVEPCTVGTTKHYFMEIKNRKINR